MKLQNTDQNYHLLSRSWSNYTNCLDKEDASFLLTINQVLIIDQGTLTLKTLYICNVEGSMKMDESGWCWLGDMDEVDKNR